MNKKKKRKVKKKQEIDNLMEREFKYMKWFQYAKRSEIISHIVKIVGFELWHLIFANAAPISEGEKKSFKIARGSAVRD